jgi:hypothetical protein
LALARSNDFPRLGGREIINLALLLSFPVIGLDQFLRTPPAQFTAAPAEQVQHWVTDSLMMLPLFAAGVWAGDRILSRAAARTPARTPAQAPAQAPAPVKRALVIVLSVAVALIPVWFERNKTDTMAQSQALVTPHSHGGDDVYWVGSAVILALLCVCLIPAAAWAARAVTRRLSTPPWARASVLVVLVAAAPAAAALLHNAAEHAYASQVNYTSALLSAPVRSHAYSGGRRTERVPVTAAPFAFVHQTAHALQDGLAGQAAGLPVASMALRRHRK